MATDLERMVVSLEASITKYEKAMQKAVGDTQRTTRKIQSEFDGLDKRMGSMFKAGFTGLTAGLAAGAASFLSIDAAIQGTTAALDKFGQIADLSAASAMNPEFFQGIAYQASLAGVSIETLGSAMATFAKNSALAAEGHGKLATQLAYLNPELLKSIQAASTQEERFRLVVDALSKTADEAQRVALATAAFGGAGAQLAGAFSGGLDDLNTMLQKAEDLGLVIDNDIIAKADEMGDAFDTASQVVDTQLKVALLGLAPVLIGLLNLVNQMIGGLNNFQQHAQNLFLLEKQMDQFPNLTNQLNNPNPPNVNDLYAGIPVANSGLPGKTSRYRPNVNTSSAGADLGLLGGAISGMTPSVEQLSDVSDTLFQTWGEGATVLTDISEDFNAVAAGGHKAAGGAKAHKDAAVELIEKLKLEQEALGQSSVDQEVNNALRQAGANATAEQKAQIESLVRAIEAQKTATDMSKEAMKEFADLAKGALSGFIDDLRAGKSATEALGNALNNIANKLLDKGLDMLLNAALSSFGTGGFGFALGGVAMHGKPVPMFASGGVARGPSIFGEHGAEAAVPLPNGRQIPVDLRMGKAGGASGPPEMKITVGVSADSMGNILPFVESVSSRNIARAAPSIISTAGKAAPSALAIYQRDVAGSDYRLR